MWPVRGQTGVCMATCALFFWGGGINATLKFQNRCIRDLLLFQGVGGWGRVLFTKDKKPNLGGNNNISLVATCWPPGPMLSLSNLIKTSRIVGFGGDLHFRCTSESHLISNLLPCRSQIDDLLGLRSPCVIIKNRVRIYTVYPLI